MIGLLYLASGVGLVIGHGYILTRKGTRTCSSCVTKPESTAQKLIETVVDYTVDRNVASGGAIPALAVLYAFWTFAGSSSLSVAGEAMSKSHGLDNDYLRKHRALYYQHSLWLQVDWLLELNQEVLSRCLHEKREPRLKYRLTLGCCNQISSNRFKKKTFDNLGSICHLGDWPWYPHVHCASDCRAISADTRSSITKTEINSYNT